MVLMQLTEFRPDKAIKQMVDGIVSQAHVLWKPSRFEGHYPVNGFGIAELAPYHINRGSAGWGSSDFWSISFTASNTWQDFINATMTDQAYAIVTGIFDLEAAPIWTHLRPSIGGESMPVVNVEQAHGLDVARAWLEKPFAAKPSNNITVRVKGNDAATERAGHTGYAIAKRALLITEA